MRQKVKTKTGVVGEVIEVSGDWSLVLAHREKKSKTVVGWFETKDLTPYIDVSSLTFEQKVRLVTEIQNSVPHWNQAIVDELRRVAKS